MANKKGEKKPTHCQSLTMLKAAILLESIEELKALPDATENAVSTDDKFYEIIKNNFEIIYDALTVKGKTKTQLIEMWHKKRD